MKQIGMWVDEGLLRDAKGIDKSKSLSDIVREALQLYVDTNEPKETPIFRVKHTEYKDRI